MRNLVLGCLSCALLVLPVPDAAAQVPLRVKIDKVQVGFRAYAQDETSGRFKVGLWTPVYVYFSQAPDGPFFLPAGKDGVGHGELLVETTDSDDVQNLYRVPFAFSPNEQRPVLTYTKTGVGRPEIRLGVVAGGHTLARAPEEFGAIELGEHLYLTLGARINHFQDALLAMAPNKEKEFRETKPREAAYETDVLRLPTEWFGYDAVDLMVLTTENNVFLDKLAADRTRWKAVGDWVRRGGRLVISVAWRNQDKVHALLQSKTWQPPLPDLLSPNGQVEISQLFGVRTWSGEARDTPFPAVGQEAVRVAKLNAGRDVEVLISERNGEEPVMVRVPYGLGSVTLVGLDLDKGPFSVWHGRVQFWKALLSKLGPRVVVPPDDPHGIRNAVFMDTGTDLTTSLQRDLDKFDVAVISFGWVALFILLYILVVGPVDYLILKKVFKHLEWTWITFPSVVLLVSGIAYFTAYALKGNDLKINKVDLIDLDLRSDLTREQRTRKAYAYGTSWFSILSPRIQSYTMGIEPALRAWNPGAKDDGALASVLLSWLGRPEAAGMGGMGRQRSQGLFRRAYKYAPDATGLHDVPIPVWATKAFTASWETPLAQLPFSADLHYNPHDIEQPPSGTLKNNLPADLLDVWVFYGGKWYPFGDILPGARAGGQPVKLALDAQRGTKVDAWVTSNLQKPQGEEPAVTPQGLFNPTQTVKSLMFLQSSDSGGLERNHSMRRLDQSWRLSAERSPPRLGVAVTREAILFGRLARARGPAEQLTADLDPRLPTHLWLGEVPGEGKTRPELPGTLVQDTYLRVYLPVTPAQP
jgi:hypothetical protein